MNKTLVVVSRIANSCIGQAVIVTTIVVSVKVNNGTKVKRARKSFLMKLKYVFVLTWFAINVFIFKYF